jgi:signal transduction histidine kinase
MLTGATPQLDFGSGVIGLAEVAHDAAAAFAAMARTKQVRIVYAPSYQPDDVRGDRHLLSDAVLNLVKNAVEAAPVGSTVQLSVTSDGRMRRLVIEDEGPGIPAHLRNRLFEPQFSTKLGGAGLGLFTSFGIIRQHGGRLLYEDANRGGARFVIEIPAPLEPKDTSTGKIESVSVVSDSRDPFGVSERLP